MNKVGDLITKWQDGRIVGQMMVTRIVTERELHGAWVNVTRVYAMDYSDVIGCVGPVRLISEDLEVTE